MENEITICFQTTSKISNALDKIAEDEKLSVSEVVDIIINSYFKDNKGFKEIKQNRRRFERKKVEIPAYIGDPRWQRRDFEAVIITDISIGGIRFAVPKDTKLEIQKDRLSNIEKYIIIFSLPNYHCPVNVQIAPQQVYLHSEDVQIGAALINPDFQAYTALQKYMI